MLEPDRNVKHDTKGMFLPDLQRESVTYQGKQ